MSATYIIRRAVGKFMAVVSLIVLFVLTPVIKLLAIAFDYLGIVMALFLAGIAVHFYFRIGFTMSEAYLVGAAALVILMKFVLVFTADYLAIIKKTLKDYVLTPIIVKSPVKYTI